jgi:uncharacterized protein YkwD
MSRSLIILAGVLAVAACTVYPLTPTPDTHEMDAVVAPTVVGLAGVTAESQLASTRPAGLAVTLVPPIFPTPTEAALTTEQATPAELPNPTQGPLAIVVVPTSTALVEATAGPPPAQADLAPASADTAASEQHTIDLVNLRRAEAGVPPLARDETLMSIARARVADMVARGYTGHNDPMTGELLGRSLMRSAGYTSNYLGENWYGSSIPPPALVETAMAWFMNDAPHARNILSQNFVAVGVGIAYNGQLWLLVQNFAGQ